MKDISFISAMFEEIKSKISVIEKKLDENYTILTQPGSSDKEEKGKPITAEELLRFVQKTIIFSTQKELQKALPQFQNSKKELLDNINDLRFGLKNLKCYRNKNNENSVINNFKFWRIISIIASILFLSYTMVLKIENNKLKDNDLKFRFIYMNQGIDSACLQNLETIFHINRDRELIKSIREDVEEYELKAKKALSLNNYSSNAEPE